MTKAEIIRLIDEVKTLTWKATNADLVRIQGEVIRLAREHLELLEEKK